MTVRIPISPRNVEVQAPLRAVSLVLQGMPFLPTGHRLSNLQPDILLDVMASLFHPPSARPLGESRILSLTAYAGEIFGSRQKALRWLSEPHPALGGQTPLEAAATDQGFQEAEDILGRLEYGVIG
jgi:hypothetical protein